MMAQDETLEQRIETALYTAGVQESGAIASAIVEQVQEWVAEGKPVLPEQMTVHSGTYTQEQLTGFILRVFQYIVESQPNKILHIDLGAVKIATSGRKLDVMLDGATFSARTTGDIVLAKREVKH